MIPVFMKMLSEMFVVKLHSYLLEECARGAEITVAFS